MKEKYIAPTTSSRVLEIYSQLLTDSIHGEVPGGGIPDTGEDHLPEDVKEFNFNDDVFNENPWVD